MNYIDAFEQLQLEPTTDKKAIKKAYAALVKEYHPEEFPEEWQLIHSAYEIAIKYAGQGRAASPPPLPSPTAPTELSSAYRPPAPSDPLPPNEPSAPYDPLPPPEQLHTAQNQDTSQKYFQIFDHQKKSHQERIQTVLIWLEQIESPSASMNWITLLNKPEFRQVILEKVILDKWSSILQNCKLNKKEFVKMSEMVTQAKTEFMHPGSGLAGADFTGVLASLNQVAHRAELAFEKYYNGNIPPWHQKLTTKQKPQKQKINILIPAVCVILVFVVRSSLANTPKKNSVPPPQLMYHSVNEQSKGAVQTFLDEKYGKDAHEVQDTAFTSPLDKQLNISGDYNTWIWEANQKEVYFDNVQVDEITKSIEDAIRAKTGLTDLFVIQGYELSMNWFQKIAYHEKFNGDLKDFADREAAFRSSLDSDPDHSGVENGSVAVYFKDPDMNQIGVFPEGLPPGRLAHYGNMLAELEAEYHIRIAASWVPQDYYDLLSTSDLPEKKYGFAMSYGSLLQFFHPPYFSALMSASYLTGTVNEMHWDPLAQGVWYSDLSAGEKNTSIQLQPAGVSNSCRYSVVLDPLQRRTDIIFDKSVLGCSNKALTITRSDTSQPSETENSILLEEDYTDIGNFLVIPYEEVAGNTQSFYTISW